MTKWYTRHADSTAATTAYAALTLDTRNNTVTAPKIADGYEHIKYIVANVGVDAAHALNVGNIYVLKLSGDAMYHGDQELIIGAISSQETGTSVTEFIDYKHPFILPTNIWLKSGQVLDMNVSYYGTDLGTPIIGVSIGVERGRGGTPLQYRTRGDSHTNATDAYEALELKADGSTGAFDVPRGVTFLNRIFASQVWDAAAATVIGGNNWVIELSGDAVGTTAQEINCGSFVHEAGAGTITATTGLYQNPNVVPAEIPLIGGNALSAAMAFKGTDLGTPFVGVTLELVGGLGVR